MVWTVTFFDSRVETDILALPAGHVARFIRYAERMEAFGPDLGMPHPRAMGDGLFELRIRGPGGIARVFYCTIVRNQIVFLHQFVKKTDRTPVRELEVARRRLKEIKND